MPETSTAWSLVSLSPLPLTWQLSLSILTLAAIIAATIFYQRRLRSRSLSALRWLAGIAILAMLYQPGLERRSLRNVPQTVAVVFDRSRSMAIADPNGLSRDQSAQNLWQSERPKDAPYTLALYDLDGPLPDTRAPTPPAGEHSNLVDALRRVVDQQPASQQLAGIVLFSDGGHEIPEEAALPKGVPINTIDAASHLTFQDVGITEIKAHEFAFIHQETRIEVTLNNQGFDTMHTSLTLSEDGKNVQTQTVELPANRNTTTTFTFKPRHVGDHAYQVSLPSISGDAVAANNQRSVIARVIRDKIRVLHVAGKPTWDERFLRQYLKASPNIDLVSFFILRTPTDTPGPEQHLSLIPFPVRELFTEELPTFDVLIFQDFDYRPYRMAAYLPHIRRAVEKGLGFIMLGGNESFGTADYAGTPLADILPIDASQPAPLEAATIRPQRTNAGEVHPITAPSPTQWVPWHQLPSWPLFQRLRAVPQATVLAHHDGLPLILTREVGEGRVLAIASNQLWRWRFTRFDDGRNPERVYRDFWDRALRWLVHDPAQSIWKLESPQRIYAPDNPINITLQPRFAATPMGRQAVDLTLRELPDTPLSKQTVHTDKHGHATWRPAPKRTGSFVVEAQPQGRPSHEGTRQLFVVEDLSPEVRQPNPQPENLHTIANATGGRFFEAPSFGWNNLNLRPQEREEIGQRDRIALWDNIWTCSIILLLLGCEWLLRRRHGYI